MLVQAPIAATSAQTQGNEPFKFSYSPSKNIGGHTILSDVDGTIWSSNGLNQALINAWKSIHTIENEPAIKEIYFLTSMSLSDPAKVMNDNYATRPAIIQTIESQGIQVKGVITSFDLYLYDLNSFIKSQGGNILSYEELLKQMVPYYGDKGSHISIADAIDKEIDSRLYIVKKNLSDAEIGVLKDQIREAIQYKYNSLLRRYSADGSMFIGEYYHKYILPFYAVAQTCMEQGLDFNLNADYHAMKIIESEVLVKFIGLQPTSVMHKIGNNKGAQKAKLTEIFINEASHKKLAIPSFSVFEDDYSAVKAVAELEVRQNQSYHGVWVKTTIPEYHNYNYYRGQTLACLRTAGVTIEGVDEVNQLNAALVLEALKKDFQSLQDAYSSFETVREAWYKENNTYVSLPYIGANPASCAKSLQQALNKSNCALLDEDFEVLFQLKQQADILVNTQSQLKEYLLKLKACHDQEQASTDSWLAWGKSLISTPRNLKMQVSRQLDIFTKSILSENGSYHQNLIRVIRVISLIRDSLLKAQLNKVDTTVVSSSVQGLTTQFENVTVAASSSSRGTSKKGKGKFNKAKKH